MRTLVWFRRDLRVHDNPALYHAAQSSKDGLIGIFLLSTSQWLEHDDADCKVTFWLRNLEALSKELAKLNIPLLIADCNTFDRAADTIVDTARTHDCGRLYFNREYEVNERRRDQTVVAACDSAGVEVSRFHDRVLVAPGEIQTRDGRPYSVFTPFYRVWQVAAAKAEPPLAKPRMQPPSDLEATPVPTELDGYELSRLRADLWPAGEDEALKRLHRFAQRISDYDARRDLPAVAGTSLLSPYLAAGVISPRQCQETALSVSDRIGGTDGIQTWLSELAWRDFYTHVLVAFPRVSMHRPFKLSTEGVRWRTDDADLQAWQEGRTGFPLVDAGMRQLNQTGWMHNRLRMVTAMFLTKNLLIDWRWGEKYFMQQLIDGDLAANNGGWQWSASTGTDSVPYFRIFNPFSQSRRFDPDGEFIKRFCPELSEIPSKALHDPVKLAAARQELDVDYPGFIVDYKAARQRALDEFKRAGKATPAK